MYCSNNFFSIFKDDFPFPVSSNAAIEDPPNEAWRRSREEPDPGKIAWFPPHALPPLFVSRKRFSPHPPYSVHESRHCYYLPNQIFLGLCCELFLSCCTTHYRGNIFSRVWCTASLISLIPILAVAFLRVNALFPLLTSLAGSSPALVFRVSWDGPTPCILFV